MAALAAVPSPAQLCDADTLSHVLSCLDTRDFAVASRACRQWAAAATRPSAWPVLSSPAVYRACVDDWHTIDPHFRENMPPEDPPGVTRQPPRAGVANSRLLRVDVTTNAGVTALQALTDSDVWCNLTQLHVFSRAERRTGDPLQEAGQRNLAAWHCVLEQLPRLAELHVGLPHVKLTEVAVKESLLAKNKLLQIGRAHV